MRAASGVAQIARASLVARLRARTAAPRATTTCMSSIDSRETAKKARGAASTTPVVVATHDGAFHCDEALGIALLRRTRAFANCAIERTRDEKIYAKASVVIDVGATYDADKLRFDHHQKSFDETFGRGFATKLSSAGLVYKHFGEEIVEEALRDARGLGEREVDRGVVEKIYVKIYEEFIEGVDGNDNGVERYDAEVKARYKDTTGLPHRVKRLNPEWDEPFTPEKQMEQFLKAVALTGAEFDEYLSYYARKWLPARQHVEKALDNAKHVHPSGEILKLETFCPWKEHLYELEAERGLTTLPKFMLWQDSKGWRVSTIPASASSFAFRKGLPKPWRGVRDADLSAIAGIPGCVFVHAAGFIGGNDTFEGALAMAVAGLATDYSD